MSLHNITLFSCTFVKSCSPHIPDAFDNSNNSCIYMGFQAIKKVDSMHFFGRFGQNLKKSFSVLTLALKFCIVANTIYQILCYRLLIQSTLKSCQSHKYSSPAYVHSLLTAHILDYVSESEYNL